jgi:hypothetical protein
MTRHEWKARVAALGCLICGRPANLHHVREGQGMSQRASDWLVVPLCREHHQGADGIHSGRFYHRFKKDEMDLLAETIERVVACTTTRM